MYILVRRPQRAPNPLCDVGMQQHDYMHALTAASVAGSDDRLEMGPPLDGAESDVMEVDEVYSDLSSSVDMCPPSRRRAREDDTEAESLDCPLDCPDPDAVKKPDAFKKEPDAVKKKPAAAKKEPDAGKGPATKKFRKPATKKTLVIKKPAASETAASST